VSEETQCSARQLVN